MVNAIGRRKAAIARVFLSPGSGKITVNSRDMKDYFSVEFHQLALTEPLRIIEAESKYDIKINVRGGGMKGQAEAVRLGIARALVMDTEGQNITVERNGGEVELNEVKMKLKEGNSAIMTRDPRCVERKKPGRRKARKVSQFSKR